MALSIGPGDQYITAEDINSLKQGAILVSTSDPLLFDLDAMYKRIAQKEIRAAFDENIDETRFKKLNLADWYTPNSSSAFNTGQAIEEVSASCVKTLLNLLKTGNDKYHVN